MNDITNDLNTIYAQAILFLPKLMAALVIFVVGVYAVNLFTRLLVRGLENRNIQEEVRQFISSYARIALIGFIVIIALQQIDFDLTAFIAGLGILGFTIGFALQDITQNVVSGLILLLQRPFEIGDLVEIDHFTGYVTAIDIRTTNLHTLDDRDILIPNYSVLTNPITNYTKDPQIRVSIELRVSFESDIEQMREIVREAVTTLPFVLSVPTPEILYSSFGDSALNMTVNYWINILGIPEREALNGGVSAIHHALRKAGLTIPYPIQVELGQMPQKDRL